jgi:enoyl-CoA hydratase/carnithine racemase
VVLRGDGSHFCAGLDFGLAQRLDTPGRGLAMQSLMAQTLDELRCASRR